MAAMVERALRHKIAVRQQHRIFAAIGANGHRVSRQNVGAVGKYVIRRNPSGSHWVQNTPDDR
jgi:hypothetical protein